jgi:hypothetical protein
MLVEVDSEVLNDHAHALDVIRLFDLFLQNVHEWVVDFAQIDDVGDFFGTHVPVMRDTYLSLAMKTVSASPWRVVDRTPVRVGPGTLSDLLHDLSRPAVLVVENDVSDKSFLRAIAMILDGEDILAAIDRRILDVRNGGGKHGAGRQACEHVEGFRLVPRVALLLDSDRLAPGSSTACHRIADKARQAGVEAHVLEFREAENYVPNRVLAPNGRRRDTAETSRRLTALKELSPVQRAHFDMKSGFGTRGGTQVTPDPAHAGLYDDLSPRTLVKLSSGFGSGLTKRMEEMASQGRLTGSDLSALGEGVVEELRRILHMLRTIV